MTNLSSTADDILDCAQSLILAGGYNGFSYADIAEVVGIRKASIHHHFPSKVDLVRMLVLRYREAARAGFVALEASSADPRAQLSSYVGYWEKCLLDGSAPFCVCALLASELPVLPAEVAAEVRLHFETLQVWLTSAFERGPQPAFSASRLRRGTRPKPSWRRCMAPCSLLVCITIPSSSR